MARSEGAEDVLTILSLGDAFSNTGGAAELIGTLARRRAVSRNQLMVSFLMDRQASSCRADIRETRGVSRRSRPTG